MPPRGGGRATTGLVRALDQRTRRDFGGGRSVFGASPDSLCAGPAKYVAGDQESIAACAGAGATIIAALHAAMAQGGILSGT